MARPLLGKRGYLWVTLALFVVSLVAQFVFSWAVYQEDQQEHGQPVEVGGYLATTL
ncbi:MAG TPA: hypothetical protein VHI93_04130 [Candidatus Thermoplasmatota archaeon]|nr:hypothetical protein [Candidatus Thermoplasmatota archaeon]